MFALSWIYMYGVGLIIYGAGTFACVRAGVLDFSIPTERRSFIAVSVCFGLFAAVHALFQYVLPFVG